MARKFLVSIDLTKNELQNAVIQNLASAPASPNTGQIYFNTVDNQLYIYNGTRWEVAGNAVQSGLLASRPLANAVDAGTIYYATDTYLFYYSDGSTWTQTNAFGSVTAQTSYGASSGNGSATTYARADHTHGTPALGTATPNAISGAAGSAGSGTAPSKEDHTHAFTPSQNLNMGGYKLTALGTPSASTDAATKQYVDDVAQGLNIHAASYAATTANLNATYSNGTSGVGATLTNAGTQAAFTTDGTTPSQGDRILVKNQTTTSQNGIYTLTTVGSGSTNWVLTRATDFDTAVEIAGGDFTFVDNGTTYANTGWVCVDEVTTVGTDPIVFQQFSGAGTYTASNGITLTGTNFTFTPRSGYGLQTGASGAEIKLATTSGLNLSSDLAVGAGNGISVLANTVAIDSAVVVSKYAATFGDGSATSYTITHNLNTRDVVVSVYEAASPYAEVICDVAHATANTITLAFSVAPTSNQYRVVVHA
ncbi:MAG: hypothetical protein EBU89_01745 [Actinobacteria bacterium]|nr:hypothetical protein [Actinomycetota bacterium]